MQVIKRLLALNAHMDNLLRMMLENQSDELQSEFFTSLGDFNMLAEELSGNEPAATEGIVDDAKPDENVVKIILDATGTDDTEPVVEPDGEGFTEPEENEAFSITDDDDEPTEAEVSVITAADEAEMEAEAMSMAIEDAAEGDSPVSEDVTAMAGAEAGQGDDPDSRTTVAKSDAEPDMPAQTQQAIPVYDDEIANACEMIKVDEMLSRRESIDFRHAFTLNDKYRFRRELFGGSEMEFADAVNMVIAMGSFEEACDYFYITLQWDATDDTVADFMKIVENHFKALK